MLLPLLCHRARRGDAHRRGHRLDLTPPCRRWWSPSRDRSCKQTEEHKLKSAAKWEEVRRRERTKERWVGGEVLGVLGVLVGGGVNAVGRLAATTRGGGGSGAGHGLLGEAHPFVTDTPHRWG